MTAAMTPSVSKAGPARPRIDPDNPPYADLRKLLQAAFKPQALSHLSDIDPFKPLRYQFSSNPALDNMIDVVLEFCRTQSFWEELLDAVAERSPVTYNRFADQLGWPRVSVPAYAPPLAEIESTPPLAPESQAPALPSPPPAYADVEIRVSPGQARHYPVTIQTSLTGDASGSLALPWTLNELRQRLGELELEATNRDLLAVIGGQLFQALFNGYVRDRYVEAVGKAQAGLRLRLWFDPPELQALPWELLYDAERNEFLALSGRVLVTRYLSVPRGTPPLAVTAPLSILVVTAAPKDRPLLAVDAEAAAVQAALEPLAAQGLVRVSVLPHAQVMTLRDALRDFQPHVLHFAGHGGIGPEGGALILEGADGRSRLLSGSELSTMLKFTGVRLAVLNACLSARSAAVEAGSFDEQRRALLGVGPALVRAGLGAVVAMQFSLADEAARLFAQDVYRTLARLEPADQAVARAREALMLEIGEGRREWATPVLFLRAPDGVVFYLPKSSERSGRS